MFRLILCLCLIPLFAVHAQKQPTRTCRILFLNGPDSAPNTLHLFDGKSSREVELPRMNLSKVYDLPAGPITLSMLAKPLADPTTLPAQAPRVTVAESLIDLYLLVTSDPANTVAPVRLQVINANADQLKAGQILWFNLTEHAILGRLGSESLRLNPQSRIVMNAPTQKNEDYAVIIKYRRSESNTLSSLCDTKWLHDTRSRCLGFVFNEKGSFLPRILIFPDYREPPEEKP